jgi:hypothetical protein
VKPSRVVLHQTGSWLEDAQEWADTLKTDVVVPLLGDVDRHGEVAVRDESGARWHPAAKALVYHPARPGRAPRQPDVLAWAASDWSRPGLLTKPDRDQLPEGSWWRDTFTLAPGGGVPVVTVEVVRSGLFVRSGGPVDDAVRAAARGVQEQRDGWILHRAPGVSQARADVLLEGLTPAFRRRLMEKREVVVRPVPDPGVPVRLPKGFRLAATRDSAGLVPDGAAGGVNWAASLAGTLYVGAPGDTVAGRPVLSLQEVADYLRAAVPEKLWPARVLVNRPVDGQRWADELQTQAGKLETEVIVTAGELDEDGSVWARDESGARWRPVTMGLGYYPARPGEAPQRPLVYHRPVADWLSLEVEPAGPRVRRLPPRAGAPAHTLHIVESGLYIYQGLPADDSGLAAVHAAGKPAGGWSFHINPNAAQVQVDAVIKALRDDDLRARMIPSLTGGRASGRENAERIAWLAGQNRMDEPGAGLVLGGVAGGGAGGAGRGGW